jgi:hypothetical protein
MLQLEEELLQNSVKMAAEKDPTPRLTVLNLQNIMGEPWQYA